MKSVIVIGAGVIGCCSAYYLKKMGFRVVVIDRVGADDDQGCSYINCGYISPSHYVPLAAPGAVTQGLKWMVKESSPLYIKPSLDPALIRWLWLFKKSSRASVSSANEQVLLEMNIRSRELYMNLAGELEPFEFSPKGLLILSNTVVGHETEMNHAHKAKEMGLETQILKSTEIEALEPDIDPQVKGGVYYPNDAHFNPGVFMKSMRNFLSDSGVIFKFDSEVKSIADQQVTFEKKGMQEVEEGEYVVLAAGSWSREMVKNLEVDLPLQGGKGYSMTVHNPAAILRHPAILSEARVALTPFQGALRVGGTMEIAGLTANIRKSRVAAIQKAACTYFSAIEKNWFTGLKIEYGLRPVSPDGLPYVGRLKNNPKTIVAAGHAMLGMSLGPVTGEMVANLIGDMDTKWQSALSPERFK